MNSTFEDKSKQKEEFPLVRRWIGEGAKGMIVVFHSEKCFTVLYMPSYIDNSISINRSLFEVVDVAVISCFDVTRWEPVTGKITIEIP